MPHPQINSFTIFRSLMEGGLSPAQAAVLFCQHAEFSANYISQRIPDVLNDPHNAESIDLDSPAGRLLQTFWLVAGATKCIISLGPYGFPLVDAFFEEKLHNYLDHFSERDLEILEKHSRDEPIQVTVRAAQSRWLAHLAEVLLKNPSELNIDIAAVRAHISEYNFPPELSDVFDKVGAGLAAGGDRFDQAALLGQLRTFFEKLHELVGLTLRARKNEAVDNTNLGSFGQAIEYLSRKGVLKERMRELGKALYGVLCSEGAHALKSDREYVRLCRNMVAEYALVLFFELDRRLQV